MPDIKSVKANVIRLEGKDTPIWLADEARHYIEKTIKMDLKGRLPIEVHSERGHVKQRR
jgi:hypothetical protein